MARILIVDDKEENLQYLEALLTAHGHQVLAAENGKQALEMARVQPVQAVVSDLLMPVMDGYSLLQNWKQEPGLAGIPFIVYTATYTEPDDEKLAYSLGADAFLLKPLEPRQFLDHLDNILSGPTARAGAPETGISSEQKETFKLYNQALVRKLEQRSMQLEESNIQLQRDIAERERVEMALRESEAQLRQLTEAIPQLVWIGDGQGLPLHVNQNWVDFTGLSLKQSAQVWDTLAHPDDAARVQSSSQRARQAGEPFDLAFRLRRADGQYRWMLVRAVPMCNSAGAVIKWFGTATDIDDIKSSEVVALQEEQQQRALAALLEARVNERTQALREANEALERSRQEADTARRHAEQASNAKSEFLSRMSHELRTPLNAILGFGQLLEISVQEPHQQEDIQLILQAGRHLLALINDVLDIARIETGHLELQLAEVDLAAVAREAVDMTRPLAAARGITITNRIVGLGSWKVAADRKRLVQVLLNLLSNATKYNRDRGQVMLSCHSVAASAEPRIRLEVQDTGPGLPGEGLDRIFDPFERLNAKGSPIEGTGIGLSLSKWLVEAMNGQIGVESTLGAGSTFWVELPAFAGPIEPELPVPEAKTEAGTAVTPPSQVEPESTHEALTEGSSSRKLATVLYIEDHMSNIQLVEQVLALRREPIHFAWAQLGETGLASALELLPQLVLLDVNLPDIQGDEVFGRLRADERTAGIPVVVLSADATEEQIQRFQNMGAVAYVTKPLNIPDFLDIVSQVLEPRGH